jgi:tetratricopeptide (TPR) repeat protein/predicted Ser/Thr protein kinase
VSDERIGSTVRPRSTEETVEGTGGTAPPDDQPLVRGDLVGRYVVLEPIGRGAMGVVYKAFDPQLDRAVAVKLLVDESDDTAKRRAVREAKAIAKISHPNVIAVHDVGTHRNRVFFAMELVDGQPLGIWKEQAQPDLERILEVFRQAGAGLAAAHAAGLVHRDFKPDNVLVDGEGRVRVLDFGLARRMIDVDGASKAPEVTPSDQARRVLAGTPAYMAPEQFGGGDADARSDQFAFCVALHEALTGERPFQGDTVASLSYAVLAGDRTSATFTGVPAHVIAAVDRGLSHEPDERFPSMEALVAALTVQRREPNWGLLGLAGMGILLAATGTAYGIGLSRNDPAPVDPCADVGQRIDDVWNDAERVAVRAAFLETKAYNAESAAERVDAMMDAYASRWRRTAAQSCQMTEVDRTLDAELSFRSKACIDEALQAFEFRLSKFKRLQPDDIERAVDSVDALGSPAECVDRPMLELMVETPSDPTLRREVAKLQRRFNSAVRHFNTDSPALCLEELEALEEDAREVGHGPTLVNILQLESDCLFGTGQDEAARAMKHRVFEQALAVGHDLKAIQSAAQIAHTVAVRTVDFDRAEAWIRTAEALAERHRLQDVGVLYMLLNVRGVLASRRGNPDEAVRCFKELAELTRGEAGTRHSHLTGLSNIGVTLANEGRHEEALEHFRTSVAFAEKHWGANHGHTVLERGKLAQTLYLLGRIEEARDLQQSALEATSQARPVSLSASTALHMLGMIERRMGNDEAALDYLRAAYEMRERLGANETAEAFEIANALSALERTVGDAKRARELALMSLTFHEQQQSGPLNLIQALSLVAAGHHADGELETARRVVARALTLAESDDVSDKRGVRATVLYQLGFQALAVGKREPALRVLERAEASVKDADSWKVAGDRLDYANVLADADRPDEARDLLAKVERTLETHPYPPTAVEGAKRLRERLGP